MESIDDIRAAAGRGAAILQATGASADFEVASLAGIDRLLERDTFDDGAVYALGCYFGEVVCRALDAHWTPFGRPVPEVEDVLEVTLPNGSRFWPALQVWKQFAAKPDERVLLADFVSALKTIDARVDAS